MISGQSISIDPMVERSPPRNNRILRENNTVTPPRNTADISGSGTSVVSAMTSYPTQISSEYNTKSAFSPGSHDAAFSALSPLISKNISGINSRYNPSSSSHPGSTTSSITNSPSGSTSINSIMGTTNGRRSTRNNGNILSPHIPSNQATPYTNPTLPRPYL